MTTETYTLRTCLPIKYPPHPFSNNPYKMIMPTMFLIFDVTPEQVTQLEDKNVTQFFCNPNLTGPQLF